MANNGQSRNERIKEFINTTGGFLTFIAIIVGASAYVVTSLTKHGDGIERLNEKFDGIEENYADMQSQIWHFTELSNEDHKILVNLAARSKEETAYNVEVLNAEFARTTTINNEVFLSDLNLNASYMFAKDWNDDITYTVEDLCNYPIITSYKEGDNDVYFYGRYNENGNWNGTCILNTYNGDDLVSIFEGVYEDGTLFSYKRVSDEKDGTWLITDRISQDSYNVGKTWKYTKTTAFTKSFDIQNIQEKQMMTVDKFLNSINENLISYYKGNTSNGLYNDDTGNAYLVKYKEDGDVELLYKGGFKDGYPNDNTGNAWSIAWGYANDGYHYFKGKFVNNDHKRTKDFLKPMTQEEINEKVNPNDFDCLLTGLIVQDL